MKKLTFTSSAAVAAIVTALFGLMLECPQSTSAQEITVFSFSSEIRPETEFFWTGWVEHYSESYGWKEYQDHNYYIRAGIDNNQYEHRGYAKFNISTIPNDAAVVSVRLWANTGTVSSSPNHALVVTELTLDPEFAGGSALFADISSNDVYYSNWTAMRSSGWHSCPLNTAASNDLQNHLSSGLDWWAVGFRELNDDDSWGGFSGYSGSNAPYCVVTYNCGNQFQATDGEDFSQKSFEVTPNPCNSSAILRFSLPNEAQVKLTVYDLLGRPIKSLLETWLPAGLHLVPFKSECLPSGVYIARLEAGPVVAVQRVVLLK